MVSLISEKNQSINNVITKFYQISKGKTTNKYVLLQESSSEHNYEIKITLSLK